MRKPARDEKSSYMTFLVYDSERARWKAFCEEKGWSMTTLIKRSVEHTIEHDQEVQKLPKIP